MKEWSEEETNKLLSVYNKYPNPELLKAFPERTFLSIYKKARKLGLYKDEKIETINRKAVARKGKESEFWRGGRCVTRQGYVQILMPNCHRADKSGYVFEHIYNWETANNRELPDGWVVHHLNGVKNDNRPENLVAMTISEHTILHNTGRIFSQETKKKMSERAKARFNNNIQNHPRYKDIDIDMMQKEIASGETVVSVCKKHGINKATYYKRIRRLNSSGEL